MLAVQLLLLIVLLPLAYGPIGHYFNLARGGPDLALISVWLWSWLTDRPTSLRWALLLGVAMDLVSFLPFGLWTSIWVGLTLLLHWLKLRFFEVSSTLEALLSLLIANGVVVVIEVVISRSWPIWPMVIGVFTNTVIGLILYYLLAVRYRLFARWEGKRL